MAWHPPWDLYHWFVNVFAGNEVIFLTIAFGVIASLAGLFRMPGIVTGVFFGMFIVMISVITGNLYILVLFIAAIIIGWMFSRYFR